MKKREKRGNNKKRYIIAILVFLLIFIVDFVVILVMKSISVDSKKDIELINNSYPKFEEEIKKFSSMRDEFYKNKENDFYLDSMKDRVEFWNKFMNEYEKEIDDIDNLSKDLKDKCIEVYASSDINSKCNFFNENYEAVINYYVTDITLFNTFAKDYNKENETKLDIVDLKYDYIDINKDGNYIGKIVGD